MSVIVRIIRDDGHSHDITVVDGLAVVVDAAGSVHVESPPAPRPA